MLLLDNLRLLTNSKKEQNFQTDSKGESCSCRVVMRQRTASDSQHSSGLKRVAMTESARVLLILAIHQLRSQQR